jgi:hypothetical protein
LRPKPAIPYTAATAKAAVAATAANTAVRRLPALANSRVMRGEASVIEP